MWASLMFPLPWKTPFLISKSLIIVLRKFMAKAIAAAELTAVNEAVIRLTDTADPRIH